MSNIERYRPYFTKDYLMGPNSFRLLDELIRRRPEGVCFERTLDLGCGFALTSLFIANETDAKQVFAFDLWISATENYLRIRDKGLEDRIIPIHGDANDMPFAKGYFDTIISVDAYHYFGCREGVCAEKILPDVKKDGYVMIAVPGLREQPRGDLKQLFETWAEGDDAKLFKTAAWWDGLLKNECGEKCEITVKEAECFDIAWQEWFDSGHEYGIRDREFLQKGLDRILNFVMIYVRKNG
ncbi:MAG: methyltransferase domain-containing protein [Clostridia bacterium]|nr:methyltransferase domain-containing protein [Clostridia bacterium]